MSGRFFNAKSLDIGFCKCPECRAVHIHLLDATGTARAQAVVAVEDVEQFIADLRTIRDRILGAQTSLGRH